VAKATFVQRGETVDYTPAADVAAGSVVVLGDLVAVAPLDIKANTLGALSTTGVWDFPKATGAGSGIAVGTKVYWDVVDGQAKADSETAANKYAGKVVKAAADGDKTVRVRLEQ
jgi:predicted RecA/RadA family phage recombinase